MKDDKSRILPLLMDPRQPDENNRAYAYRILRKNIMNIQLQPGCQLSEAELSEHLVMSRTPIHEALMMLKGEWLVDVLPQRGSIVSKISIQYINEGYAMRKMLEPALLRSLSGHLNQAQLSELHGLLEQQDGSACISHDVLGDYFITLDNEFHKRLYTYAGYDRIWQAMHNVTTHMDRVRYLDTALCQMDMETFRVAPDYYVVKFTVPDKFIGYYANELNLDKEFGLKMLALKRAETLKNCLGISFTEHDVVNELPDDDRIQAGDRLVCYGRYRDFQKFWKAL